MGINVTSRLQSTFQPTTIENLQQTVKAKEAEAIQTAVLPASVSPQDTAVQAKEPPGPATKGLPAEALHKQAESQGLQRAARPGSASALPSTEQLQSGFQAEFSKLAAESPEKLAAIFKQIFEGKVDGPKLGELLEQAKNGTLSMPANVKLVEDSVLQGAKGAYSPEGGGTIYLNKDLLKSPEAMKATFTEEMGHHLDQKLGGADTRGDEGEMLKLALRQGGPLSEVQRQSLIADKDQGSITVDGKQVQVEFDKAAEEVKQYSPSDFADKPVSKATRQDFMRNVKGEAFANFAAALSELPEDEQNKIVKNFGEQNWGAKLLMEGLRAKIDGETERFENFGKMVEGAKWLPKVPPGMKQFLGIYGKAIQAASHAAGSVVLDAIERKSPSIYSGAVYRHMEEMGVRDPHKALEQIRQACWN